MASLFCTPVLCGAPVGNGVKITHGWLSFKSPRKHSFFHRSHRPPYHSHIRGTAQFQEGFSRSQRTVSVSVRGHKRAQPRNLLRDRSSGSPFRPACLESQGTSARPNEPENLRTPTHDTRGEHKGNFGHPSLHVSVFQCHRDQVAGKLCMS